MLAYAAYAPRNAERRPSPHAMLAIIAAHVALLALVMSAKMDFPGRIRTKPLEITWIDLVKPPPPNPIAHPVNSPHSGLKASHPPTQPPPLSGPDASTSSTVDPGPVVGPTTTPIPDPIPLLDPPPVRTGPQLLTSPSELRPPYPPAKLASGEEAVLKLQLTIDERGHVVDAEPIGRADGAFLAAARRHLLAHWRYKPASVGSRAVTSTMTITLRFQLDG